MKAFLEQVAAHYCSGGGLGSTCFIFPNRRSIAFFRKHLCATVAASGARSPEFAPGMFTVNDFFAALSGRTPADRIELLVRLYSCYRDLNPEAEPLDDFIFWGDVLLADFDDIDKYLVNPSHLLANVADLKEMGDDFSYLSPAQEEAIRQFIRHFEPGVPGSRAKSNFLSIWKILAPLYNAFRENLDAAGICYEGQAYRQVAESLDDSPAADILGGKMPGYTRFVFVGLNALNECEKKLMRRMRDAGLAEFCWDYSSPMIRHGENKSSFFMATNVTEFKPAFEPDGDGLPETAFTVVSVPGGSAEAKLLPDILARIPNPGMDTAIVLPDEDLLLPVLNSIPEEIENLNVTMGYPMSGSALWSLMNDIAGLQLHLRRKDDSWWFYHRQVWSIFSNSVFRSILREDEAATVAAVRQAARYYIPAAELQGTPLMDAIFRAAVSSDASEASSASVRAIEDYQQSILSLVAERIRGLKGMALELDFARECWLAIGRLRNLDIPVKAATYFKILASLMNGATVPFEGEPLRGLQIMGPLETRSLDFDNVIILSCNEGSFPRHSVSASFIPAALRKGFGLPTYEYQDAVWAYYFYRLIQRARHVWMVFNSSTSKMQSGEESRYIKQLELHFGVKCERYVASAPISGDDGMADIAKTEEQIRHLREDGHLSASSLQNYLECPAKFYFRSICGLKEDEEVSESLDDGMFGSVFHDTMQELYEDGHGRPRPSIGRDYLRSLIAAGGHARIKSIVNRHICEQLKSFEVGGRNLLMADVVLRYVLRVLECDLELLDKYGVENFRLLGIEKKAEDIIHGFKFVGRLDRLDSFDPDEIRVVDYKTGAVKDEDFLIDDGNAREVAGAVFGPDNAKRPGIALQLYLYDRFVKRMSVSSGRTIVNSIYQTRRIFTEGVGKVALCDSFCDIMDKGIEEVLDRLADVSVPWSRTSDRKSCEFCQFKTICGK